MKLNKKWLLTTTACGQDKQMGFDHEPTQKDIDDFYARVSKTCRVYKIEVKVAYFPETNILEPRDYQGSKMRDQCDI